MTTRTFSLMETYGWHEWLCHTNFSFLAGASHPHEYIERALRFGYRGIGVVDFDGVYGLARSYINRRNLHKDIPEEQIPLKLFYGAELHFGSDHDRPIIFQDTLALVAQSLVGYRNLCGLSTLSHQGGKDYAHVSLAEMLAAPLQDLVAIQPMRGLIRQVGGTAALRARLVILREAFPGRLYLTISRHLNPSEDVWIPAVLALSRELDLPCLLSQDPFMHEPLQKDMSDVLHAIRTNLSLDKAVAHMFVNSERSLHDLAGIAARFQTLPIYEQALRTSRELADSCNMSFTGLKYHYPKEMIPENYTPQAFLEELVWEAARQRFGAVLNEKITKILTHELKLIEQLKFPDYFLTVWDIVKWARQHDILCQGRGSAANSAVCYVLGITAVDPDRFDMLFERFVSMERGDPPDIDVDFEHERREEVIQYIYARYGRARAAMVANVITFRSKGALRAVGKALGAPEAALGEVSKWLGTRAMRGSGTDVVLGHVAAAEVERAEVAKMQAKVDTPTELEPDEPLEGGEWADIPWELWADLAQRLKGFPRHLGIHSGGFIVSQFPLDALVAQEPATMEGRSVIQWSKEDIEGVGLFKIDILALGILTAIRKSLTAIAATGGPKLTLATIPAEDPATYQMIQRADTVGTFQIESRAQMSMLPRLRPKHFYDLAIEVAIVRPGPIQGGMIHPYLKRREGIEPVSYPDERLRPILERTLGIPLFQEQVMRIAMTVGDFTPGEANELRRHMGAWTMKGDMGPWLVRLARGMRKNGLAEDFVQSILGQMQGFAHYGFPESHAVSFALLAYASSWLKCHHPAAFFYGLLNSQPMGFYSPHALLQAAQRDKVKVLPVCVQRSMWDSSLEGGAIRLGYRLVAGLREDGAKTLIAAREKHGGFASVEHLIKSAVLYRNDLTALAAADAFHTFGLGRRAALWLAEGAPFLPTLEDVEEAVVFEEESTMERAQQDFGATGTSLGPHPTVIIRSECWCYDTPITKLTSAAALPTTPDGQIVQVFGMVLVRQAPPSANGMVFFTLEDETGFHNLAFTPQVYQRFYALAEHQAFLCLRGRVQRRNESHSLMVMQVYEPKLKRADVIPLGSRDSRLDPSQPTTVIQSPLAPSRNYM